MPEIPDLTIYIEALKECVVGARLDGIRLASPFLLRTVSSGVAELVGKQVTAVTRLAKQLVFALEDDYYFVLHLMISGRLRWDESKKPLPKRNGLAAFDFSSGTMLFTEASKKSGRRCAWCRAQMHCKP
jgi:formamidopyrimidine-DNA glycosylase